jgi:membrane-associated phospholipid phosphatase
VWLIAPAMYGGATVAGVSRMYNNKHWASDVITGAAIGTMAGVMVVRWNHTHDGNRLDRWFLGGSVSPSVDGRTFSLHILPIFAP